MMDVLTLGSLRVRRVVKTRGGAEITAWNNDGKPPFEIILMHGFGAPGDDLVGLVSGLDVPTGTVFFFPEAPHALQDFITQPLFGDARAWWMIDFAAMERAIATGEQRDLSKQVPEGLAEAREVVEEMLEAIAKTHSHSEETSLVLGGFSQGAMLALDVALRGPSRKLAGVVLLSGTLIAEHEWTPLISERARTPVFQSHGESDPILPFAMAERLRNVLEHGGLDVTFERFAGPHTITPRTLSKLSAWLRDLVVR